MRGGQLVPAGPQLHRSQHSAATHLDSLLVSTRPLEEPAPPSSRAGGAQAGTGGTLLAQRGELKVERDSMEHFWLSAAALLQACRQEARPTRAMPLRQYPQYRTPKGPRLALSVWPLQL